jgi:hypothetical protein
VAARQQYPSVPEQLFGLALQARSEGLSFDEFWTLAVRPGLPPVTWKTPDALVPAGAIRWPNDSWDRTVAQDVHADPGVVEGWRCAYERREAREWRWVGPLAAALDPDASGAVRMVA